MIKRVEAHESINNSTVMKNSEVSNKHKNKDGKLKNILSIWHFKCKRFRNWRLLKHNNRLCAHGGIKQWRVNYRENPPVVNRISVISLLDIECIHEFPIRSIDFVLDFNQYDLDVDVLVEIYLVMGVDENIREWVLQLNKSLYGINQTNKKCFDLLKNWSRNEGSPSI